MNIYNVTNRNSKTLFVVPKIYANLYCPDTNSILFEIKLLSYFSFPQNKKNTQKTLNTFRYLNMRIEFVNTLRLTKFFAILQLYKFLMAMAMRFSWHQSISLRAWRQEYANKRVDCDCDNLNILSVWLNGLHSSCFTFFFHIHPPPLPVDFSLHVN